MNVRRWPLRLWIPGIGLLIVVVATVFGPIVAPHNPNQQFGDILEPPSLHFLMGTDQYGRDVLSRVIYGGRASLVVGLGSTVIAFIVGTAIALVAGYFRGWAEWILMRAMDVILCLPPIITAVLVVTLIGPGIPTLVGVIGFMFVPLFARVGYGQVLSISQRDFVTASRALGASSLRVMARTIFPNVVSSLIVQASLSVAAAILIESGLSFLGLGVVPPTPSWGNLIAGGEVTMLQAPWALFGPAVVVVLVIVGFNILGDGLRDALDPRLRQSARRMPAVDKEQVRARATRDEAV